jgi:hypothetical protein
MIEREYVWIDGPPASGKTTFIERLIVATRNELVLAARFVPAKTPKQSGPAKGNDETKRYADAGAIGTMLFRVPSQPDPDAFWSSEFIENYSRAIIIEGAVVEEILSPSLVVCVMCPLPEGESLLVKGARAPRRIDRDSMAITEQVLFKNDPKRLGALHEFERMIPALGLTPRGGGWAIRDDSAGVTQAAVIVINVHDEGERPAAERLAAEVRRIREDAEIKNDVIGLRDAKRQPIIVIANLANAKDKELKKAITRVKRMFVRARSED